MGTVVGVLTDKAWRQSGSEGTRERGRSPELLPRNPATAHGRDQRGEAQKLMHITQQENPSHNANQKAGGQKTQNIESGQDRE